MTAQTAVGLAVVLPLAGVVLIVLFRRWPNLREAASLITGMSLFAIVARVILPVVQAGGRPHLGV
ncbi:MAG: monovalent cation/H+ antiporter subunit D family protein, partial [Acidobacteria bacterium]|nr:monovalent cation/H+ antiporter subunit D family protein [Candidatus Sulfomarinibacter sp. MAG AM2]